MFQFLIGRLSTYFNILIYSAQAFSFNSLQVDYQPSDSLVNPCSLLAGFNSLQVDYQLILATSGIPSTSPSFNSLQVDYQPTKIYSEGIEQNLFQFLIGRLSTQFFGAIAAGVSMSFNSLQVDYQLPLIKLLSPSMPGFNSLQVDYQLAGVFATLWTTLQFQFLIGRLSTESAAALISQFFIVSIPYRQTINKI